MDDQGTADIGEERDNEEAAEGAEGPEVTVLGEQISDVAPVAANDEAAPVSTGEDASDDASDDANEDDEEGALEGLPDEDEDAPVDEARPEAEGEDEDEAANYELDPEHVRMAEALLFAAADPLNTAVLKDRMPQGVYLPAVLAALGAQYENHGVQLVNVAGKWAFRTAPDLSFMMEKERVEQRRLSRAAIETLAIIAYHQPVTRAEIEAIRGVSVSKGTVDVLLEVGWIKLRGRRRVPGRPVTYGTSEGFLDHFGLDMVKDLPGMEELKAAGLLDARLPSGFAVPSPEDALPEEEDDEDDQEDLFGGDIATPFDDEMDQVLESAMDTAPEDDAGKEE
jgi:segregation and condensation protein B